MARLRKNFDGSVRHLESEHAIGRSPRNELCLTGARVSSQHALLRWNGEAWEIKDLGSRNGTWLDGTLLESSVVATLQAGARLRFGDDSEEWVFEDAQEPRVMVVNLETSDAVFADGPLLPLPSAEVPEVTLYVGGDGAWNLEREDTPAHVIQNRETFVAGGRTWRFSCPSAVAPTQAIQSELELRNSELIFGVSADEEYVELSARCSGRSVDLGSRSHYYLLLTLARLRLEDLQRGVPEPLCGWTYQDELLRALNVPQTQLNIDVFRVRKQLAAAGFVDAARAVERRPSTRQLRVGVSKLQIQRV